jgi:MYXO-CTERM domain-containing protein
MKSLAFATLLVPSLAAAHIALVDPPPRTASLKAGPCGAAGSVRGTNVTTYRPGQTITVKWNETIEHPGHYRVSFDPDGQDFSVPPDFNTDTGPADPLVIKDLIPDVGGVLPQGGRPYSFDVTLPDMECTNCTLQVIQMMTDKPPYGDGNDIYFQCADITLANDAPMPDAGVDPMPDSGGSNGNNGGTTSGGCSVGGAGSAAGWPLALALLGLVRRRNRT